jgi:exonuclease III
MSESLQSFRLGSLNVTGLSDADKQRSLATYITKNHPDIDILLLQESHLSPQNGVHMIRPFPSFGHFSFLSSTLGGVTILINRKLFPSQSDPPVFTDLIPGRAAAITVHYCDALLHIISIYAPANPTNRARAQFFEQLHDEITTRWARDAVILSGDFNCVLEPDLDRADRGGPRRAPDSQITELATLVRDLDLVNAFRTLHPQLRRYTCRDTSRIDRWYITTELSSSIHTTDIITTPREVINTDHKLITLHIRNPKLGETGPGTWKLNLRLLEDPSTNNFINTSLSALQFALENRGPHDNPF